MAVEQTYLTTLLGTLESTCKGNGRPQLAGALARIKQRLAAAPDLPQALKELARVKEWQEFAIRLAWCLQERASLRPEVGEEALLSFHAEELRSACASSVREVKPEPTRHSMDFEEALLEFGKATEGIKRGSFQNGEFTTIPRAQLDTIRQRLETLRLIAESETNEDVQKFCSALTLFLEYATDHDLLGDVRVANLLDNANLTIQTVHSAVGAEEYDALHQMIQLLESPGTLLE